MKKLGPMLPLATMVLFLSSATRAADSVTLLPTHETGLRSFNDGVDVILLTFDDVKKFTEDRTVAHFDLRGLSGVVPNATLNIPIDSIGDGFGLFGGGTLELYAFAGDGTVSVDEWDAGTLFTAVTVPLGQSIHSVDITNLVQAAVKRGDPFLSFSFRASGPDRYGLSEAVGLPEPSILMTFPSSKAECKQRGEEPFGWEWFGFKNQGQCIQFVNTGK